MNLADFNLHDPNSKLPAIINTAVDELHPDERAERIRYCQETGDHGCNLRPVGDDVLEIHWGGKLLRPILRDELLRDGAGGSSAELS